MSLHLTDATDRVARHVNPHRWATLESVGNAVVALDAEGNVVPDESDRVKKFRTARFTGLTVVGHPPNEDDFAKLGSFIDRLIQRGLIRYARLGPIISVRLGGGPSDVKPKWVFIAKGYEAGKFARRWHRIDPEVPLAGVAMATLCGEVSHVVCIAPGIPVTDDPPPESDPQNPVCAECWTHFKAGTSAHGRQVERHALLFCTFSDFTREVLNAELGGSYFVDEGELPPDHLPDGEG